MPGVVRKGKDSHVGHASPSPAPFHGTSYAKGSPNVYVNSASAVRIGDTTACGDPASAGSPNVYVNSIKVHRLGDGTGGHGSWVPNASASSSSNVFANGGGNGGSGTKDQVLRRELGQQIQKTLTTMRHWQERLVMNMIGIPELV